MNVQPILLDWEYAGVNDRYFDLACVECGVWVGW